MEGETVRLRYSIPEGFSGEKKNLLEEKGAALTGKGRHSAHSKKGPLSRGRELREEGNETQKKKKSNCPKKKKSAR